MNLGISKQQQWLDFDRPKSVKNCIRALSIVFVLMLLRGIASGNRVELHIIGNKYSFCDLVLGDGPTQSELRTHSELRSVYLT